MALGFALAPLKRQVPTRAAKPIQQDDAYRWSRLIQRQPWPSFIVGTLTLVVLALPVFGLRLGFSDEGNFAEDTTTRQAYDLLADGFGPGLQRPADDGHRACPRAPTRASRCDRRGGGGRSRASPS